MATNFLQFKVAMRQEVMATREEANRFKQFLGLELLRSIINRTPVKTGAARANWQVGIGTPIASVTSRKDKNGVETILKGRHQMAAVQAGQTIWLSNNLPYILVLENGSSILAPAGMVQQALELLSARYGHMKEVPKNYA